MTHLSEQFTDAVGPIEPTFTFDDITQRVKRRRRSRRRGTAVAATLVSVAAIATILVLGTRPDHEPTKVQTVNPSTSRDLLVFNATGGVLTYDLGSRRVQHVSIDGWRAGDQPFWSLAVGDHLVVGWGDVYSSPVEGGASQLLGTGVFLPAVEPGAVWLTSYGGVQTPTERLVDMRGRVLLEALAPIQPGTSYSAVALTGIPGGLVFESKTGLDIWDAKAGSFTRHLGSRTGEAAPAFGSMLPWCDRCTEALELTDLTSGITRHIPLTLHQESLEMNRAVFSPDGTQLAIPTFGDAAAPSNATNVVIVDTSDGHVRAQIAVGSRIASVAWSADGNRLYVAGSGKAPGHLLMHDTLSNTTHDLGRIPNGALSLTADQTP